MYKDGPNAVQGFGKASANSVGFDLCENTGAKMDGDGLLTDRAGHGDEDAVDLGLLFVEQANQFVVLFDSFEGLNEDCLPGRRRAMNDAGNLAFELGFDGDDEAVATDGDEVFLRTPTFAKALQGLAEAGFDGAVLAFHGAANASKLRGGVVAQAAVGFDLAA